MKRRRHLRVGVYADGTERMVTSLRSKTGLVGLENAEEYLARNYGADFAALWESAREGRWRARGVRWVTADGLRGKPGDGARVLTWPRFCAEQLAASEGDPVLEALVMASFSSKERELWCCTSTTMH